MTVGFLVGLGLVGCPAEDDPDDDEPTLKTCAGAAQCLIDDCTPKLDRLEECIDDAGSVDACDRQNLAHGNCVDACNDPELSMADEDAAFTLYLCEFGDNPECAEPRAACPDD